MGSHGAREDDGRDEEDSGWCSVEEEEDGAGGRYLPYFPRHEGAVTGSEGDDDEEEAGGMDVMDAFEAFNIRLFDLPAPDDDAKFSEDADEMPAYTYMSDQVRLSKPPQFQHWQSAFQYLQVMGSAMLGGPSEDYICVMPGVPESSNGVGDSSRTPLEPLVVSGRQCLTVPDGENETNEETIEADGDMEEILAQDFQDDDHEQSDGESVMMSQGKHTADCVSPRTTQMLEVVDALTFNCFSTTVAPLMTSFFQVLLQKQQTMLRIQREAVETAAKRTVEERLAAEQAERICEERRAIEEAERAAAVVKAAEEEAIREAERQGLLRQQQREENDGEEVKIRTLAYSHTREWYQPNKKCFSHRGRQLTYLKPVLTTKEQDESNNTELVCASSELDASPARKPSKKSFSVPQKPARAHPESLKESASSSKGVPIRQQQRRPSSHSRSPPRSRSQQSQQREDKQEVREHESFKGQRVRLPLIRGPWSGIATEDGRTSFSRRCSDDSEDGYVDSSAMVHSSRPRDVYAASPYRIPPSAASVELAPANKTKRRGRKTRDIHNPA